MRLYGEIIDRTGSQTMLYLTCITITSVDLAYYGVSRVKDWVSVDCGTSLKMIALIYFIVSEINIFIKFR